MKEIFLLMKNSRSVFSQDKSGIYNLYMTSPIDSTEGYVTNVTGGAFMPDLSEKGVYCILYMIKVNIPLLC